ncbi:26S proteasome regulatory subunit 4 [Trichoderma asperellum]|uniref:26S proteasome regulatory subunit 4 n=1 Tax=Trichoderma asperellum TaxID=101201 RepID=A0A6V8RBN4_TRIAP|nr:26S proteasome regulatory subunit 4 [Trichoderma asperellum]
MIVAKGAESLDHQCLWMAFRPSDLIYVSAKGYEDERIYRLVSMEYKERILSSVAFAWCIKALCIVSDGNMFGERQVDFTINQFHGIRQLHALPVFPLKYHPEAARIYAQWLNRGKKFCGLYSWHYLQYNGVAELLDDDQSLPLMKDECSFSDWSTTARPTTAFIPAHSKSFDPKLDEHRRMSDDDYVICSSKVAGYSLDHKQWGYFRVDLTDEVVFNENAFDSLILDARQKQQIQSLVHIHGHENMKFDDIIQGKGKGLVILLYGEPGVGKTLTAESVADKTRRPLLRLDASSLGTTAASVEKRLMATLRFSEKWNAVALLDEADVLFIQRNATDLEHNCIMSVFLRVLEYYSGILFLTANRIGVFNRAVKSHIHLAIHYPKPSRTSRQSLWNLFLSRSSEESTERLRANGTLDRIADEDLNGRQIKNTVQLAYSLALQENSLIKPHHINTVLQQLKDFEEDFQDRTECVKRKRAVNDSDGRM